jgi:hypothetical protein
MFSRSILFELWKSKLFRYLAKCCLFRIWRIRLQYAVGASARGPGAAILPGGADGVEDHARGIGGE